MLKPVGFAHNVSTPKYKNIPHSDWLTILPFKDRDHRMRRDLQSALLYGLNSFKIERTATKCKK